MVLQDDHTAKESGVPLNPLHSLAALSSQHSGEYTLQPLPADEQLALLLHMAESRSDYPSGTEAAANRSLSLHDAYMYCQQITRIHSKSFFFSTQFLPPDKCRSVRALYAFCRASDDTVDMARCDPAQALAEWVRVARAPLPPPDNAILLAWHDTRLRYNISTALTDELLAGIAMDLTTNRYETFADLWLYCYRVASVVGLLCMGIVGAAPGSERYAITLGVALQMTNILRDVGEDARRGRVYVPEEDLRHFGLTAQDILAGTNDKRFKALMQFEIDRTQRLYDESWEGIALLPADSRLAVGTAACTYRGILDKVIANDYDVYHRRAHLTASEKIVLLPGIWRALRRLERRCKRAHS
jgi:phytoene synthase